MGAFMLGAIVWGARAASAVPFVSKAFGVAGGALKWGAIGSTAAVGVSSVAAALPGEGGEAAQDFVTDGVATLTSGVVKLGGSVVEGGAEAFTDTMKKTLVPAVQENALYAAVPLFAAGAALRGDWIGAGRTVAVLTAIIKMLEDFGVKLPGMELKSLTGEFNRATLDIQPADLLRDGPRPQIDVSPEMLHRPSM